MVNMNKKQKVVIWVGLGLILLSFLFPAYEGEWRIGSINLKKYLGYYLIFSPPNPANVSKAFAQYNEKFNLDAHYIEFNTNIITSRFFIQIVTILILTIGLAFLFADLKKDKNGK